MRNHSKVFKEKSNVLKINKKNYSKEHYEERPDISDHFFEENSCSLDNHLLS